jgi:predicted dehydrogenase
MNKNITRRDFLRKSFTGTAGALFIPSLIPSSVLAGRADILPNDKINMGFIGVGNMGTGHLKSVVEYDDVKVIAVCDVRKKHRDRAKKIVDSHYDNSDCVTYNDYRELLARKDIDAVLTAAPDHWHALIGIEAARQGKHMYYEKPMSLTLEEGKAMRDAVNKYGVIFQFGTQQRSDERFRTAVELVRNGRIGNLEKIIIGSASYTPVPVQPTEPVPEGFDYDFWLGPAPWSPHTSLRCTRQWTLISDYSLGCLSGAWGIHHVDIAQWATNSDKSGPVEVKGEGSVPKEGLFDTYRTWMAEHTYENGIKLFHGDFSAAKKQFPEFPTNHGSPMGMMFKGTNGWIYVKRGFIDASQKSILRQPIGASEIRLPQSNDHRRNFLDAVRTGQQNICPVETAVRSETVCQQAYIAMELGEKLKWDPVKEAFINNDKANAMLSRPMRSPWHL